MRTRRFFASLAVATVTAFAALAAQAAGIAEVSFVGSDKYSDAGTSPWEVKRTTDTLAEHFKTLAQRLPDGQVLKVKVTDIDLAGEIHPNRSRGELRVLRGRADWPRIDFSFTLEQGGRTLQSGDVKLSDMAYLQNQINLERGEPLAYELRMLSRWVADLNAPKLAH